MCSTVQFGESLDVGLCGYQGKKIEISRVRENEDGVKLQTFKTTTLQMLEPSRKKMKQKLPCCCSGGRLQGQNNTRQKSKYDNHV